MFSTVYISLKICAILYRLESRRRAPARQPGLVLSLTFIPSHADKPTHKFGTSCIVINGRTRMRDEHQHLARSDGVSGLLTNPPSRRRGMLASCPDAQLTAPAEGWRAHRSAWG